MFKLVCGAGNEDCESVKRLVYVWAKAGSRLFDLSARKEILAAAKEGASLSGVSGLSFCVSIGIKGDKHIKKAKIDSSKCIKCSSCYCNCPNDAVISTLPLGESQNIQILGEVSIDEKKCIGCSKCFEKCPVGAISMEEKDVNYREILPYMVSEGVEVLELHIMGHDKDDLAKKWQVINECNPKYASICIDRENFGNREVLERIKEMIAKREPYTTIIQADGIPMSGSDDSYKTTLQAVAMAEIIQNANLPVHLMLSGGTNSKTAELCRLCGINYWGIAVGSWARKIVKPYITAPDFWENNEAQANAIEIASKLVEACA